MEEKCTGLLLDTTSYLERGKILKVFTEELGLVSLFSKGRRETLFTTPFCLAEWVIKKGKNDLYLLLDASLLNPFSHLKKEFSLLSSAGKMASLLLSSQLPMKKGGDLYRLALSYFQRLKEPSQGLNLTLSFQLKLLVWEGVLGLEEEIFSKEEQEAVLCLAFSRKFDEIERVDAPPSLEEKVESLVMERL